MGIIIASMMGRATRISEGGHNEQILLPLAQNVGADRYDRDADKLWAGDSGLDAYDERGAAIGIESAVPSATFSDTIQFYHMDGKHIRGSMSSIHAWVDICGPRPMSFLGVWLGGNGLRGTSAMELLYQVIVHRHIDVECLVLLRRGCL